MTRQVKINEAVIDQFPVFDFDGYTKLSGQTFVSTVWKDAVVDGATVTITEIGSSGEYKMEFTPDSIGFWKVEVFVNTTKDVLGFFYAAGAGTIEDVYSMTVRLLGLNKENIFVEETQYDGNGQLISARIRLFDSKANCDAATSGGSETTGLVATYTFTNVWENVNEFEYFKQVKE